MDATQRLTTLQQQIQAADRQRAQAEAQSQLAKQQLAEVDAKIRALGIEPDDAETELANLDHRIQEDVQAIELALQQETAAYQAILRAGK